MGVSLEQHLQVYRNKKVGETKEAWLKQDSDKKPGEGDIAIPTQQFWQELAQKAGQSEGIDAEYIDIIAKSLAKPEKKITEDEKSKLQQYEKAWKVYEGIEELKNWYMELLKINIFADVVAGKRAVEDLENLEGMAEYKAAYEQIKNDREAAAKEADYKSEVEGLTAENAGLTARAGESQEKIAGLTVEKEAFVAKEADYKAQVEGLTTERDSLVAKEADYDAKIAEANQKAEKAGELESQLTDARTKADELTAANTQLQETFKNALYALTEEGEGKVNGAMAELKEQKYFVAVQKRISDLQGVIELQFGQAGLEQSIVAAAASEIGQLKESGEFEDIDPEQFLYDFYLDKTKDKVVNPMVKAQVLFNLGAVYAEQDDHPTAKEKISQARDLFEGLYQRTSSDVAKKKMEACDSELEQFD